MKHFLNREMLAPNVMTIPVDRAIVEQFADPVALRGDFSKISPKWSSDVQWISAADEPTFDLFQSAFDRLGRLSGLCRVAEAVAEDDRFAQ
jgi:hypothetical protein